jgi:hypothetical protein
MTLKNKMKNFLNENGEVVDSFVGALIESSQEEAELVNGDEKNEKAPEHFYENDGYLFGISSEVITSEEGDMYARIFELDSNIFESLNQEEIEPVKTVEIDEQVYVLSDEISLDETTGEVYVKLVESEENEGDNDETATVEIDGIEYEVVDNEEDADLTLSVSENEDGELEMVEDEDDADGVLFLKEL